MSIKLKPFPDMNTVPQFNGTSKQDAFVLSILNGKNSGTFLEIGAAYPQRFSNTYALETYYGWTGVMIEKTERLRAELETRKAALLIRDATEIDYGKLLDDYYEDGVIDYLSLDIDPPSATLDVLGRIPLVDWKFRAVTYEHDHYRDENTREASRAIFKEHGYHMAHGDVKTNDGRIYEDWWVHPDLVDMDRI